MTDGADRAYLARQYADDRNLAARQAIYAYQQPRRDIFADAFDLAGLRGDERILDAGCGNGRYLAEMRARSHRGPVIGLDRSPGMLAAAGPGPLVAGDVQALPFPTGTFDVALAMHMLYHVPDRAAAIAELRRVLRRGGTALVVTNYAAHVSVLDALLAKAAHTIGIEHLPIRSSVSFTMDEGGPELEVAFDSVVAHEFTSCLVVDEVAPIVAYAGSMGVVVSQPSGVRDRLLAELEAQAADAITRDGAVRIPTAVGCFVCQ